MRHVLETIRAFRLAANLTQRQLAGKMGCSRQKVSRIECGQDISVQDLRSYLNALNIKVGIDFVDKDINVGV